jgi:hypothetical protein
MALIPVVDGGFELREGRHPYLPVRKDATFQWINYFGTVLKARGQKTDIVTIVLPVADADEAATVAKSASRSTDGQGNLTVSFESGGKKFSYTYRKESDGLVLR